MPAESFFSMLESLIVRRDMPPWNSLTASPVRVHPALLVHRVAGLKQGLYIFLRDPAALPGMRRSMRAEWLWEKTGPDHLPLYLLLPYDLRDTARLICCHQNIAADSCFALGMLAQFPDALQEPWSYQHFFWECGMLGQALYLEAEVAGIRATGIGCFSIMKCTRYSESRTTLGRVCTTSPWVARWTTPSLDAAPYDDATFNPATGFTTAGIEAPG